MAAAAVAVVRAREEKMQQQAVTRRTQDKRHTLRTKYRSVKKQVHRVIGAKACLPVCLPTCLACWMMNLEFLRTSEASRQQAIYTHIYEYKNIHKQQKLVFRDMMSFFFIIWLRLHTMRMRVNIKNRNTNTKRKRETIGVVEVP